MKRINLIRLIGHIRPISLICLIGLISLMGLMSPISFIRSVPTAEASLGAGNSPLMSLNSGLVGYWTFDGQDTNWATGQTFDRSGNGRTGTLTNMSMATTPVAGKIGQAFRFRAANNYDFIRIGTTFDVSALPFTISAWVKPAVDYSSWRTIISKRDGYAANDMRFDLQLNNTSGDVWLNVGGGGDILFSYSPPLNVWTHLTVVARSGATDLYVNGTLTETLGQFSLGTDGTAVTRIGDAADGGEDAFLGLLDDVRIYNRALSAQEIQRLYALGSAALKVNNSPVMNLQSGLVGYWTFDGQDTNWATGQTFDRSGNKNTGTLTNMSTSTSPAIGKFGQAFKFDGVDDYVSVPDSAGLRPANVSISAWIKTTATGKYIVAKDPAITLTNKTNDVSTSDPTTTASITWTAGARGIASVAMACSGVDIEPGSGNVTITGGGVTWNQLDYIAWGGRRGLYVFLSDGTPTNATLSIDYTNVNCLLTGSFQEFQYSVDEITGFNTSDVDDPTTSIAEAAVASNLPDVGTIDSGDLVYAAFGMENANDNLQAAAGSTEHVKREGGGNVRSLLVEYSITDDTPGATWDTNGFVGAIGFIINMEPAKTNVPYALDITSTGKAEMMFMSNSVIYAATSTTAVNDNKWHHVVGTYDGETVRTYVDGVLEDSNTLPSGNLPSDTGPLRISADYQTTPANFFGGSLDDIRLYNRALSAGEVQRLYALGTAAIKVNSPSLGSGQLANGLVGYWTFDGQDTNWATGQTFDRSGNKNTGTLTNMSTSTSPAIGKFGQAFKFDGVDDVINISGNPLGTGPLTVSLWVYAKAVNEQWVIVDSDVYPDIRLGYNAANSQFIFSNDGGTTAAGSAVGSAIANTWQYVTVVRNSSNQATFYINGIQSDSANQAVGTPTGGSTVNYIGNRGSLGDLFFNGSIDDVRIYNRALSAGEVQRLYQMGR